MIKDLRIRDLQLVRNAEYFLRSQHIENVGPILAAPHYMINSSWLGGSV